MKTDKKTKEQPIEDALITKLHGLNFVYQEDIRNQEALEANFRKKFGDLNDVRLLDIEFKCLLGQIVNANAFRFCTQALHQRA
ncbi:MAG: hypothetical protein OXC63_02265 [Aestuariivita sp.]|nr:hypothetical protein [Aestuariivita sp.]MCY4347872.1 hypothetical protein [Aestuariivita sp.]